jgi:hypothetical protein
MDAERPRLLACGSDDAAGGSAAHRGLPASRPAPGC